MQVAQTTYRKLEGLSASNIKLFDRDRYQFYREEILKEKRKQKNSDSIIMGNIVDFALSDCNGSWQEFEQRFDEKFKLLSVKKGSGQMFLLADLYLEYTLRDTGEDGMVTGTFAERFEEAFNALQAQDKFKGKKLEWALEQFTGSDAEIYFRENLESLDKQVVDQWMLDRAKIIVENVIFDENVSHFFTNKPNVERLGKTVIEWEYRGNKAKSELDGLTIDHNTKTVIITEIKSTWDSEDFSRTYLKLRYDLAMSYYMLAVNHWIGSNDTLKGYNVDFQFLVVDTSTQSLRPLIYQPSKLDFYKAKDGFTTKSGYRYRGLEELVDEINWCSENNQWRISKEAYDSKGVVPLKINYEQ